MTFSDRWLYDARRYISAVLLEFVGGTTFVTRQTVHHRPLIVSEGSVQTAHPLTDLEWEKVRDCLREGTPIVTEKGVIRPPDEWQLRGGYQHITELHGESAGVYHNETDGRFLAVSFTIVEQENGPGEIGLSDARTHRTNVELGDQLILRVTLPRHAGLSAILSAFVDEELPVGEPFIETRTRWLDHPWRPWLNETTDEISFAWAVYLVCGGPDYALTGDGTWNDQFVLLHRASYYLCEGGLAYLFNDWAWLKADRTRIDAVIEAHRAYGLTTIARALDQARAEREQGTTEHPALNVDYDFARDMAAYFRASPDALRTVTPPIFAPLTATRPPIDATGEEQLLWLKAQGLYGSCNDDGELSYLRLSNRRGICELLTTTLNLAPTITRIVLDTVHIDHETARQLALASKLQSLSLSRVSFAPNAWRTLSDCPALTSLMLKSIQHAEVGHLTPNLTELTAHDSPITFNDFARASALHELTLTELGSDAKIPFSSMPELRRIRLEGPVTDSIIEPLRDHKCLAHIDLHDTLVTLAAIDILASIPTLRSIGLSRMQLTKDDVQCLARMNLTKLRLSEVELNDEALLQFAEAPAGIALSVSGRGFTDTAIATVKERHPEAELFAPDWD